MTPIMIAPLATPTQFAAGDEAVAIQSHRNHRLGDPAFVEYQGGRAISRIAQNAHCQSGRALNVSACINAIMMIASRTPSALRRCNRCDAALLHVLLERD